MTLANPFESLAEGLAKLSRWQQDMREALDRIEAKLGQPSAPEWETMGAAQSTRRIGRRTLLRAIEEGRLRSRREAGPGGQLVYYLKTEDLNRHFPTLKKRPRQITTSAEAEPADRPSCHSSEETTEAIASAEQREPPYADR